MVTYPPLSLLLLVCSVHLVNKDKIFSYYLQNLSTVSLVEQVIETFLLKIAIPTIWHFHIIFVYFIDYFVMFYLKIK
jgi:hypothetical protein